MAINKVMENKVIEAKAKNLLTTSLNTRNLMTVDTSLAEEAGMTKTVNVYTYSGTAEELANGVGNENFGSITFEGVDYKVKTVQQGFKYTDEEYKKDNTIVDNMVKGANQVMVNKMTSDFITEVKKASVVQEFPNKGAISYDTIVDAIGKVNVEDESALFIVIPNAWKAALRKDPDYKAARMGEVVYNGQVGTIAGLPVIVTKALTDEGFVMDKTAVTLFMKDDVEVEPERDANTRTNKYFLRTYYICALTDNTKICKIKAAIA